MVDALHVAHEQPGATGDGARINRRRLDPRLEATAEEQDGARRTPPTGGVSKALL